MSLLLRFIDLNFPLVLDHVCLLAILLNKKGYKVFDFYTSTIFISRDVNFQEHHFPYQMLCAHHMSKNQYISSIFVPKTTCVHPFQFDDIPFVKLHFLLLYLLIQPSLQLGIHHCHHHLILIQTILHAQ